jgi:serine protease AprX
VAVLLQQRPSMTADQVKALLKASARNIPSADPQGQGSGLVNVSNAMTSNPPDAKSATQTWARSTGTGSLEAARGDAHVLVGGTQLTGETDVTGAAWNPASWAKAAATGADWSGGSWSKNVWSGGSWNTRAWYGHGWNADHFAGQTWNGTSWANAPWVPDATGQFTAKMWAGRTWTATMWASSTWSATMWAATMWAATMWASDGWA